MAKQKTILLTYPIWTLKDKKNMYRVEKLTNSVEFEPSSFLDTNTIARLCDDENWNVTIIPAKK